MLDLPLDFSGFFAEVGGEVQRRQTAAGDGLVEFAGELLSRAQAAAPVLTGALRDSGQIEDAQVTPDGAKVSIAFTAPHAAAVHEGTGQGSKFLEQTMREGTEEMAEFIGKRME